MKKEGREGGEKKKKGKKKGREGGREGPLQLPIKEQVCTSFSGTPCQLTELKQQASQVSQRGTGRRLFYN